MFCTQCGNEVEEHARFCSKCGREVARVSVKENIQHDMNLHINILGWLFVGSAILTGLAGFAVLFAGQIVTRLPIPWPPEMPLGMVPFIGSIVGIVGVAILAFAAAIASAGIGLLQYRSWGRVLAIIAAVLLLFKFPIGTGIAIYAFWVLFSEEGREHYKSRSVLA
jgi:hypothetical protein